MQYIIRMNIKDKVNDFLDKLSDFLGITPSKKLAPVKVKNNRKKR